MSFWEIDNLKSIAGGRWLQRPQATGTGGSPVRRSEPSGARMAAPLLHGVGTDTREDLTGKVFVALKGDRFDGHEYLHAAAKAGAGLLIVEHEVGPSQVPQGLGVVLVDSSKKALARLALAYRRTLRGTRVIAVAGSAGKTTTKRLIEAALKGSMQGSASPKSFNNDIGVPFTLLNVHPNDKYVIVEVGTNHLGEIANLAAMIEPDIAVITMIGREHLEGLHSLEHIARENAALLGFLRPDGMAVLNADAPLLRHCVKNVAQVVWFGEAADADLRLTDRGADPSGAHWWFQVNGRSRFNLSLPGKHNAINAVAAVAVARRLGVKDDHISAGLHKAQAAPMRSAIERIGSGADSVMIVNDAYNANPDSMAASLEAFCEISANARRRILILGDMLELGDAAPDLHREVAAHIFEIDQRIGIDQVVFIGAHSMSAAAELARHWSGERITRASVLDQTAIDIIESLIQPGDAVLLKGSRGMALERIIPAIERHIQALTDAARSANAAADPRAIQNPKSKIQNSFSASSAPLR